MKRGIVAVCLAVLAGGVLSGCGGSAYCDAVKSNEKLLDNFGKTSTNAAYTNYAKQLRAIAKTAPDEVRADWTKLATTTSAVVTAQKKVGIPLEDMKSTSKVKKLSSTELTTLNDAYKAFNATTTQRAAVVKNVKQQCTITLS